MHFVNIYRQKTARGGADSAPPRLDRVKVNYTLKYVPNYLLSIKTELKRLMGCGIKSMWQIFDTKMLIYHLNANVEVKSCISVRDIYGNENHRLYSGP